MNFPSRKIGKPKKKWWQFPKWYRIVHYKNNRLIEYIYVPLPLGGNLEIPNNEDNYIEHHVEPHNNYSVWYEFDRETYN